MTEADWQALGAVAPGELKAARLVAHYAAQPLAAAAYALLPTAPDHSHSNLLWSQARGGFVGRVLRDDGSRAFLDLTGLRIGLIGAGGAETASLELAERRLDQAMEGFAALLREQGFELDGELELPAYDLPEHGLASGAQAFPDPAEHAPALAELARWYHDGQLALEQLSTRRLGGAEVRLWPHHFDLATLRTLDEGVDAEQARSIGAGLSPGDGSYGEPYFYVSPWPAPPAGELPDLGAGPSWHTEGFTSAVLSGSRLLGGGSGEARMQAAAVHAALDAAVDASERLLDA